MTVSLLLASDTLAIEIFSTVKALTGKLFPVVGLRDENNQQDNQYRGDKVAHASIVGHFPLATLFVGKLGDEFNVGRLGEHVDGAHFRNAVQGLQRRHFLDEFLIVTGNVDDS